MEYKPVILELIEQAHQAEQALAAHLPEKERLSSGELKNWAFKEIVGHVHIWMKRQAENIQAARRGEPTISYDNYLELNDQNFEEFNRMSWQEVQAFAAQVHNAYLEMLQGLSEADLASKEVFPKQQNPLWQMIVGNTFTHAVMHYDDVYIKRGDLAQSDQIQEGAAQTLLKLDAGDTWQGTVRYNLGCHYALAGCKQKAIDLLRQGLALNPGLIEWSKQDTDLDSLRQEAEFQSLYT